MILVKDERKIKRKYGYCDRYCNFFLKKFGYIINSFLLCTENEEIIILFNIN